METSFRSAIYKLLLVLITIILYIACTKGKDVIDISGEASGAQVVPSPIVSAASANVSGVYNDESRMFSYRVSWDNLNDTVTRINFRGPADRGTLAPVLFEVFIPAKRDSGSVAGFAVLRDTTGSHLASGRIYFLVATRAYPDGELRGQLMSQ